MRTAHICFFDAFPPKSGSGVVCYDFFKSWPNKDNKLFQMSSKNVSKNKIINIKLYKNKPLFKILNLPILIIKILNFFKNSKKNILIIEGPSWIFYTFIVFIFFKIIKNNTFLIYRSHSIEYEIRLKNSNKIISMITKFCEYIVYKIANISTSVSKVENKKILQYYNTKTEIFPNSIRSTDIKNIKQTLVKKLPKKFILYSGSYEYNPNRIAINYIIEKILPKITKYNIFFVLTGNNNKNFKNKYVINLGHITKSKLKYLFKKTICLVVPLFEGYGTRIKILEAITLNTKVISTRIGIEGIDYQKNSKNFIVTNNLNEILKGILKFSNQRKVIKNFKNDLSLQYSMETNALTFYNKLKKIIK